MKILIVEDEDILSQVLQEKFEKEGFEVSIAKDGEEALVEVAKIKPDLMVLDLILPKKHGLEVLAEMKADFDLKNIPVLILSNLDSDQDIKKGLQLGAVDYFVKTQHPLKEIVEKVKDQLISSK